MSSLFHFAVNCAISALSVWGLDVAPGEQGFVFLALLAALVFLPVLFNLKSSLVAAALLYWRQAKLREMMRIEMQLGQLPTSEEYPYFDSDEYLNAVKNDASLSPDQRVKATEILTTLQTVRQHSLVGAFSLNAAIEGAIRDRFNASNS